MFSQTLRSPKRKSTQSSERRGEVVVDDVRVRLVDQLRDVVLWPSVCVSDVEVKLVLESVVVDLVADFDELVRVALVLERVREALVLDRVRVVLTRVVDFVTDLVVLVFVLVVDVFGFVVAATRGWPRRILFSLLGPVRKSEIKPIGQRPSPSLRSLGIISATVHQISIFQLECPDVQLSRVQRSSSGRPREGEEDDDQSPR